MEGSEGPRKPTSSGGRIAEDAAGVDTEAAPSDEEPESQADEKTATADESEDVAEDAEENEVDVVRSEMMKSFFRRDKQKGEQAFRRLESLVTDPIELKAEQILRGGDREPSNRTTSLTMR